MRAAHCWLISSVSREPCLTKLLCLPRQLVAVKAKRRDTYSTSRTKFARIDSDHSALNAMLRRAARRLSSSVKAQRNEAIQKRRDARLKTINTPYVEPSVDARYFRTLSSAVLIVSKVPQNLQSMFS